MSPCHRVGGQEGEGGIGPTSLRHVTARFSNYETIARLIRNQVCTHRAGEYQNDGRSVCGMANCVVVLSSCRLGSRAAVGCSC